MQLSPTLIFQVPILILALSFHEMAHAWMANRLGDPTGKQLGRLTMDPRPHIDPIGTLLFPLMLLLAGGTVFGWAKPVPFNPRNLRNPESASILIYAAGPLSNLLLALAGLLVFHAVGTLNPTEGSLLEALRQVLRYLVLINLLLTFFNFIPIPPLDGGGVFVNSAPRSLEPLTRFLVEFGPFVFLAVIFLGLHRYFTGPAAQLADWLLGLG